MNPPGPNSKISHYRLIEPLGRGAMGEVWLAEDTQLPRKVAVKLLPPHLAEDAEAVDRLLREARAAASVDHPAVVTVYEAGLHDGRPYLVMQRVEGETLAERLKRGALPIGESLELARQISDALAEVHALGIVHRDLKPSNIVLSSRGPKVLDFGVAAIKGSPQLTAAGVALGTPLAMSPEQIKGLPPDNRSDLWAMGCLIYEMLTGRHPFAGPTFEAVANRVLNETPPPPSSLRSEIGSDLDYMVLKLLRKDPAHRYSRAEDLIADLSSCCALFEAAAPASSGTPRIAVLYFDVLSANPDDAFVAAGLAEDLIVDLARLEGVTVASRADVLPFRERAVPPRTLARELGVDYVVHGSVRRAGERARISAQLVRASDGHTMWAERFDRTLEDLFEVQAEVSRCIVQALQVALKPGEREMLDRVPTRSREAYAHYLNARRLMLQQSKDANFRAGELLTAALALDPDFALAHAALGETYARRALLWWAGLELADQAMACAERALELESGQFEAQLVRAMVFRLRGEHVPLLEVLDRVLKMDPNNAEALDFLGWSYLALGRAADAERAYSRLVAIAPDQYRAYSFLAQAYDMLGRKQDEERMFRITREKIEERLARHPEDVYARSLLATILIRSGEREAGIAQAARSVAAVPDDGRVRYNAACAYARAGETERAIAELQEAIRHVPTYVADWPQHDPDMDSLRDHPEFIRMFGARSGHTVGDAGTESAAASPIRTKAPRGPAPRGSSTTREFQADHDV
ncbi:MAG: protein kinase domain-containing protein [Candidatus Eiseniibacteriota bacterium]